MAGYYGRGIVGEWLSILRELGERPDFAYGRIAPDGSITWFDFQHEDGDGAGTFTEQLLKLGYKVDPTPPVARFNRPRGLKMLLALLRKPVKGGRRVPWKDFDPTVPPPAPRAPVMLLTVEQSQALATIAKQQGGSLNSLLLHALNQAIEPLLNDPSRPRMWLIPVNVRGADGEPNTTKGNHASYIGCRIEPRADVRGVHAAIRRQLARNAHWANWWKIKTILRFGREFTKKLLIKARQNPQYWAGNFSNMGDWSPASVPVGEEEIAWCVAPPAFLDVALSSVVIIWRGRVSATFIVHPGIPDSEAKMQMVLDRWRQLLLDQIDLTAAPSRGAGSAPCASTTTS